MKRTDDTEAHAFTSGHGGNYCEEMITYGDARGSYTMPCNELPDHPCHAEHADSAAAAAVTGVGDDVEMIRSFNDDELRIRRRLQPIVGDKAYDPTLTLVRLAEHAAADYTYVNLRREWLQDALQAERAYNGMEDRYTFQARVFAYAAIMIVGAFTGYILALFAGV